MRKCNQEQWEENFYERDFSDFRPHDSIEEMQYHGQRLKKESNVANVAKAVLVVACIGLVCAIIDYYVEQI